MQKIRRIRPDSAVKTMQTLPYFIGISGNTAGARELSMHLVVIPPGACAEPHRHIGHETGIYVLEGRALTRWGENLENETVSEAGDFLFIPPGILHEAVNLHERKPARAVVARSDPADREKVVPHTGGNPKASKCIKPDDDNGDGAG